MFEPYTGPWVDGFSPIHLDVEVTQDRAKIVVEQFFLFPHGKLRYVPLMPKRKKFKVKLVSEVVLGRKS